MAVQVPEKLKRQNGSDKVADAIDIAYKEGSIVDYLPIPITQKEYNELVQDGKINKAALYLVYEEDDEL